MRKKSCLAFDADYQAWFPDLFTAWLACVITFVADLTILIAGTRLHAATWFGNVNVFIDWASIGHRKIPCINENSQPLSKQITVVNTLCSVYL